MPVKKKFRRTLSSFTTNTKEVEAQAYTCPEDGEVVLVIPAGEPVPTETEQVQCSRWQPASALSGRLEPMQRGSRSPPPSYDLPSCSA